MNEAKLLLWLVVLGGLIWLTWQWKQSRSVKVLAKVKEKVERMLRARTPEDCPPCCRLEDKSGSVEQGREVRPWREVKSRRGAPKRVNTEGCACPNRDCIY